MFGEITSSKPDLDEPTKVGELRQAHAAPGRVPRECAGLRPLQILLSTLRTIGQFWGQSGWAAWSWGHSWTPRWTINCQICSEGSAWRHRPFGLWHPASLRRGHTLVQFLVPPSKGQGESAPSYPQAAEKAPPLCNKVGASCLFYSLSRETYKKTHFNFVIKASIALGRVIYPKITALQRLL